MTHPHIAILCGGRGSRLGAMTEGCPKSLIQVAGKPFLFHQLELLRAAGVPPGHVWLIAGYMGCAISGAILHSPFFGYVNILQDDALKGTGPALMMLAEKHGATIGTSVMAMYGDSYLDCDYLGLWAGHRQSRAGLTLTACHRDVVPIPTAPNILIQQPGQCRYINHPVGAQPNHIEYGVSCIDWSTIVNTPERWDLSDYFATITALSPARCVEMDKPYHEIGSPEGLKDTARHLEETFCRRFLRQMAFEVSALTVPAAIDDLENVVRAIRHARNIGGRVFVLGVGGSAANASHCVNDLRKIAGVEAYAPTDNVAELTARTNDDGWDSTLASWLGTSRLNSRDLVLVLSVNGGKPGVSANLTRAIELANGVGAGTAAIVGSRNGYAANHCQLVVVIGDKTCGWRTPINEAGQAVVWHCIVNHPLLART